MLKHTLTAFTLVGVLIAGQCLAHAKLQSSNPANNAQLTIAPKTLSLKFNEAAKLAVLQLATGGTGVPIVIDKTAAASTSFDLPLPALSAGQYTVQWTAVAADDGHVTKGSFVFTVTG